MLNHKFGVSRVSFHRLAAVNCGLTALRHNHQILNDYLGTSMKHRVRKWTDVLGDVKQMKSILTDCLGGEWGEWRRDLSFNGLSLRSIPAAQGGAVSLDKAFRDMSGWLQRVHESGTLFEEVDLEQLAASEADQQLAASMEVVQATNPAEEEQQTTSVAAAVRQWMDAHPRSGRETEEQQREQVESLLGPHVSRRIAMAKRQQQREKEAAEAEAAEAAQREKRARKREEKEWEVEAVIDKKDIHGLIYYRVKWKGYSSEANTWELECDLGGAREAVAKYESCFKSKRPKAIKK